MYNKLPEYYSYKLLRGTGFDGYKRNNKKYQKMTTLYGYFHQFGTDIVEDPDAGNVQFTTAVIEDSHGSLHNVSIEDVEFCRMIQRIVITENTTEYLVGRR